MLSQSLPKVRQLTGVTSWRSTTRLSTATITTNNNNNNTATRQWSQFSRDFVPNKIVTAAASTTTLQSFSTITRGQDLLADSLAHGPRRKIILDSHHPTGIDVLGMIEYDDPSSAVQFNEGLSEHVNPHMLHLNGSVLAFPHMCYLWNVSTPKDVTAESLAMVSLMKPPVDFLFIGSDTSLPPRELKRIRSKLKENGIVVEQLDLTNAMGTFNILNGEDRSVAVALLVEDVGQSD